MVTVAKCFDINEAQLLKMRLEANGIAVFIPDETMAGIDPPVFLSPSGVRVQVAEEDVEAAQEVIAQKPNS
jgi:Putative prokaryotic signal transducing protein